MTSSLDKTVDLKQYARMLLRHRGLILLCVATTLCSTLIALSFIPREYESQVTLMIEDKQLVSNELQQVMGGIMREPSGYGADEQRMAKVVGRIQSRPFLERVIRILKMQDDPIIRARAEESRKEHPELGTDELAVRVLVKMLQSRLRFARSGQGIYKVTVADYSPENAQLLAKWISELFVDVSNQSSLDRLRSAHEFGAEQLRIYEQELRRAEDALAGYKRGSIEQTLSKSVVDAQNLSFADALLQRMVDEAAAARVRLKGYADALSPSGVVLNDAALGTDADVGDMRVRLATALKNDVLSRLAGGGKEPSDWPPASGGYGVLRRSLLQQVGTVVERNYPAASSKDREVVSEYVFSRIDLDAQLEAQDMLNAAIMSFRHQAVALPGGEIEQSRLENDVETKRRLLQSFQAQLVASDVSQAVELTKLGTQIEILDPASMPLGPSRPNRAKIILAALFLGPMLGVGIAFVADSLDPTLRSLHEFSKIIPEPILGTTPLLSRLVIRRPWLRRHWVATTLGGLILLTALVFVGRTSVLRDLAVRGTPVLIVNPEKGPDEGSR